MALPKSVCDNCVRDCQWRAPSGGSTPPVITCPRIIEKPKTNADRIRSMTDEELADFLIGVAQRGGVPFGEKLLRWLDWLKQEAT